MTLTGSPSTTHPPACQKFDLIGFFAAYRYSLVLPMALANADAAKALLIAWRLDRRHQIEPDAAEMAERYGAERPSPIGTPGLWCSQCGSRCVHIVVTGAE